jgi:hypothetical protein
MTTERTRGWKRGLWPVHHLGDGRSRGSKGERVALRVSKTGQKLALARTPKLPSSIHVFKRTGGS